MSVVFFSDCTLIEIIKTVLTITILSIRGEKAA